MTPPRSGHSLYYFAYGSNMSSTRLRARVPSARPLGIAVADGLRLAFHKIGRDGSAKCDIVPAADPTQQVHGVVFHIDPAHRPALDAAEGLGNGYAAVELDVALNGDHRITVFAYQATQVDPSLSPYTWYLDHVVRGAREHGLPAEYVALIQTIPCQHDTDSERHARELSIYQSTHMHEASEP